MNKNNHVKVQNASSIYGVFSEMKLNYGIFRTFKNSNARDIKRTKNTHIQHIQHIPTRPLTYHFTRKIIQNTQEN